MRYSLEDILAKMPGRHKQHGNEWETGCPVCGSDHHLYFKDNGGQILAKCHAPECGATLPKVLEAVGMKGGSGFTAARPPAPVVAKNKKGKKKDHGRVIENTPRAHIYRNPDGTEAYWKDRKKYEDGHKEFYFYHSGANGEEVTGKPENCNNLYNLDKLAQAAPDTPLYIVEGEKCVEAMAAAGFLATTTNRGANAPDLTDTDKHYIEKFPTKIMIPDNDKPGGEYAQAWKQEQGARILPLPDIWPECPEKGDIADYLEAGGDPVAIKNYKFPAEKYSIDAIETMDENAMSEEGFFIWLIGLPPTEQARAEMKAKARARKLGIATSFKETLKAFKVKAASQGQSKQNTTRYTDPPGGLSLICGDWIADDTGVKRLKSTADGAFQYAVACSVPIMPVNIFRDRETGQYSVAVAFKRGNEWIKITRPRQFWGESKKVNTLGNYGVPVDENKAKLLVKFISCCLDDNMDTLPESTSIGHLGWVED